MYSFLCLFAFFSASLGEVSIKYAAIIYRHGDRTPIDPYPKDPWRNESLWPVRFGELTNIGKKQHFVLGKWFQKRYSNLTSKRFDPKKVHIRSTDVDRTLESAQANLAGMFPPTGKDIWNEDLQWQPIPIHTKPERDDEVLAMKKDCYTYESEKTEYINSDTYKNRLSKYKALMNYLTAHTGRHIKDYDDINNIYNDLFIENLYNFTLPKWTQSVFPEKLKEPSCYSFLTATATPLMARLMVGPILKEIVDRMLDAISSGASALKMSIYSGHDFTIGNILSALGLFDGNCPPYTATILLELIYDTSVAEYSVRILYRNTTEIVEPDTLYIPGCGKICEITAFVKLYENLLTVDWETECLLKLHNDITVFVLLFGAILCLFLYVGNKVYTSIITRKQRLVFDFEVALRDAGVEPAFSDEGIFSIHSGSQYSVEANNDN